MEIYKIKNPTEEKYSAELKYTFITPQSKTGKAWNSISALKLHINAVKRWRKKSLDWYKEWIVLRLDENGIYEIGKVKDFM